MGRDLAEKIPETLKDGSARNSSRTGTTTQGQAYRLLHAILATAVGDGDLAKNPCAIPTAGQVKLDRRPILTVTDFTTILEAHSKDLHPALHLARTPKALPNAPLLMRSSGRPVTRSALQSAWKRARTKVGMEQFTFHDLRSSGLTLAAQGGATIPDLMARAGHSTSAAALLYQRTAVERGAVIAASMDAALRAVAN